MQISDVMSGRVIAVGQSEPVTAAARLLKRYNIGSLPVCDDRGRLRGIITDRDIVLRCVAAEADPTDTRISEIMSRGIISAQPSDGLDMAVKLMADGQLRRLPVTEDGRLVGMLSLCDLARRDECSAEAAEALCEISSNMRRLV